MLGESCKDARSTRGNEMPGELKSGRVPLLPYEMRGQVVAVT